MWSFWSKSLSFPWGVTETSPVHHWGIFFYNLEAILIPMISSYYLKKNQLVAVNWYHKTTPISRWLVEFQNLKPPLMLDWATEKICCNRLLISLSSGTPWFVSKPLFIITKIIEIFNHLANLLTLIAPLIYCHWTREGEKREIHLSHTEHA